MDYDTQQQLKAKATRAGETGLVWVVRALADILNWTLKFIVEMARSIVGK